MPPVSKGNVKFAYKVNAKKGVFLEQDLSNGYAPKKDEHGNDVEHRNIANFVRNLAFLENDGKEGKFYSIKVYLGEHSNEEVIEVSPNGYSLSLMNYLSNKTDLSSYPIEIGIYKGKDKDGNEYRGSNCSVRHGITNDTLDWAFKYEDLRPLMDKSTNSKGNDTLTDGAVAGWKRMVDNINENLKPSTASSFLTDNTGTLTGGDMPDPADMMQDPVDTEQSPPKTNKAKLPF